ncbi:MAG: hypothetical protein QNJ53_02795 [Pleurocapsa sp. MO_192.B19]|nr:hypothetical protein [Pleurocapsa sp. MO_192.B19]
MQKLFNVLLIEDNLGDAFLIQEQFNAWKYTAQQHNSYLKVGVIDPIPPQSAKFYFRLIIRRD